jgi:hypothetical protein
MIARVTPAANVAARNRVFSSRVLVRIRGASPELKKYRKLSRPFHGLRKIPSAMLKSLNATTSPAIGR